MTGRRTKDDVLGALTWDASLEAYEATLRIEGEPATFQISFDGASEEDTVRTARRLRPLLPVIAREARAHVVRALRPLKNEKWLGAHETAFEAEAFEERLSLRTFALYGPEGELEIWLDDGNLFWGRSITVRRTIAGAYEDAGLAD